VKFFLFIFQLDGICINVYSVNGTCIIVYYVLLKDLGNI
jgi:hypothetical protein